GTARGRSGGRRFPGLRVSGPPAAPDRRLPAFQPKTSREEPRGAVDARQRIRALQVALSRSDATEIESPAEAALFQATLRIRAVHPECGGRIIHPTRAA